VDSAILDGELVALDEKGRSRFSALQAATNDGADTHLAYYAFDLLALNGKSLRRKPLTERKAALERLIPAGDGTLRFSDHIDGSGARVIGKACGMGLEGIVSKKKSSAYVSGRGTGWLKSKCVGRDESSSPDIGSPTQKGPPLRLAPPRRVRRRPAPLSRPRRHRL
jgi:bifunctional non-homologous end joining protein LigD